MQQSPYSTLRPVVVVQRCDMHVLGRHREQRSQQTQRDAWKRDAFYLLLTLHQRYINSLAFKRHSVYSINAAFYLLLTLHQRCLRTLQSTLIYHTFQNTRANAGRLLDGVNIP